MNETRKPKGSGNPKKRQLFWAPNPLQRITRQRTIVNGRHPRAETKANRRKLAIDRLRDDVYDNKKEINEIRNQLTNLNFWFSLMAVIATASTGLLIYVLLTTPR